MPEPKNKYTVVEHVYHVPYAYQMSGVVANYTRDLVSEEQPYSRTLSISGVWKPLDVGWLKEVGVGLLRIKNETTSTQQQTIPTPEQVAEDASHVVEIAFTPEGPAAIELAPGETARFTPVSVEGICLRCRNGNAIVSLFVLPR